VNKLAVILALLAGAAVLGATALREPVAWAAQSVSATLTNVDADGNVKVREQGTVQVTGTLRTPPADADSFFLHGGGSFFQRMDMSLIHLTMTDDCNSAVFRDGDDRTLQLFGPNTSADGPRTISLPLAQPIRADRITLDGPGIGCTAALTIAGTRVP
jgi:hypothetical protein